MTEVVLSLLFGTSSKCRRCCRGAYCQFVFSLFSTYYLFRSTTIYDYDSKVSDKMVYLCRYCFPLKTMPTHICCAHPLLVRILKPLMKALMNKEARQRFLMHSARPSDILVVLSEYGIIPEVLPTEMGGAIQLDQTEWIANRRAIEMDEIF